MDLILEWDEWDDINDSKNWKTYMQPEIEKLIDTKLTKFENWETNNELIEFGNVLKFEKLHEFITKVTYKDIEYKFSIEEHGDYIKSVKTILFEEFLDKVNRTGYDDYMKGRDGIYQFGLK